MKKLFSNNKNDWNCSMNITTKGKKLYIRFDDSRSSFQHLYKLTIKWDEEERMFVVIDKKES